VKQKYPSTVDQNQNQKNQTNEIKFSIFYQHFPTNENISKKNKNFEEKSSGEK
jgi:hypothetical protein